MARVRCCLCPAPRLPAPHRTAPLRPRAVRVPHRIAPPPPRSRGHTPRGAGTTDRPRAELPATRPRLSFKGLCETRSVRVCRSRADSRREARAPDRSADYKPQLRAPATVQQSQRSAAAADQRRTRLQEAPRRTAGTAGAGRRELQRATSQQPSSHHFARAHRPNLQTASPTISHLTAGQPTAGASQTTTYDQQSPKPGTATPAAAMPTFAIVGGTGLIGFYISKVILQEGHALRLVRCASVCAAELCC
eukprot:354641-Chlamydomonas_euryale.AAC.2